MKKPAYAGLFLVGPFRPLISLLVDWDYMEEVEEKVGYIENYEKKIMKKCFPINNKPPNKCPRVEDFIRRPSKRYNTYCLPCMSKPAVFSSQ